MIQDVYKGIPEDLQEQILWVDGEYRTNSLSQELAPFDVVVEYHNLEVLGYDNVHYPSRYIEKIVEKRVNAEFPDYEDYEDSEQLEIAKNEICRIFLRKRDEYDLEIQHFKEVWNNDSDVLPWEALESYNSKTISKMTSTSETEIFQGVIDYESLRDAVSQLAGLGRIAPRNLGVSAVMASKNGTGRWLKVVHEQRSWRFPVRKSVPVGTSPRDLMFGVTIPTEQYPDVTFLGFLPSGDTEVFF